MRRWPWKLQHLDWRNRFTWFIKKHSPCFFQFNLKIFLEYLLSDKIPSRSQWTIHGQGHMQAWERNCLVYKEGLFNAHCYCSKLKTQTGGPTKYFLETGQAGWNRAQNEIHLHIHTVPGSWICEHRQRHWLDQWKTWRKSDYRATRDRQRKNQVIRTKAQQSILYQLPNTIKGRKQGTVWNKRSSKCWLHDLLCTMFQNLPDCNASSHIKQYHLAPEKEISQNQLHFWLS